ncbi:MAG: sulfotransferase [Actinobacteria bacterium]|nr:sulfotransferase [Actinomycetota bacterium]
MSRVLVVGVPRSGTTWVATILGETRDAVYVEEPDNHLTHPFAFRAKHRLPGGFYTTLGPDHDPADYAALWRAALGFPRHGAPLRPWTAIRRKLAVALWHSVRNEDIRRAFSDPDALTTKLRAAGALAIPEGPPGNAHTVVAKSVYAALSVEWIATRFPVQVVIVERDLLNVLSSWVALRWVGTPGDDMLDSLDPQVGDRLAVEHGVDLPPPGSSPLLRGTWLLGVLTLALRAAARRHPEWTVVRHEELCLDPGDKFRALAGTLGLEWTARTDRLQADLDRPGSGVERVRSTAQLPEIWRSRLRPDQLEEIAPLIERFALDA